MDDPFAGNVPVDVTTGSRRSGGEFQPLIDELFREEVRAARAMTPGQRVDLALKLSEDNLAAGKGEELNRRLARLRAINDARYYRPVPPAPE